MTKEKILIVEDDKNISKLLKYNLEKAGFDCRAVFSGEDALDVLKKEAVDIIILDLMLPKMDGFEVCKNIKQQPEFKHIPIVMLTAKAEEVDRVLGLELGADDYVVKPFSVRELTLRIKAILRRKKPEESKKDILRAGELTIDIPRHKVRVEKKEIDLTPMEFKLLVTLLERRGRVQTRERLLSDIWDIHSEVSTRTVDAHIKRLREKLGKMGKYIETIVGLGYKFKEEDED